MTSNPFKLVQFCLIIRLQRGKKPVLVILMSTCRCVAISTVVETGVAMVLTLLILHPQGMGTIRSFIIMVTSYVLDIIIITILIPIFIIGKVSKFSFSFLLGREGWFNILPSSHVHIFGSITVPFSAVLSGSLTFYSCSVETVTDFYPIFFNPSLDYVHTIHCTYEVVYPLWVSSIKSLFPRTHTHTHSSLAYIACTTSMILTCTISRLYNHPHAHTHNDTHMHTVYSTSTSTHTHTHIHNVLHAHTKVYNGVHFLWVLLCCSPPSSPPPCTFDVEVQSLRQP
jgi:hypothetical protein